MTSAARLLQICCNGVVRVLDELFGALSNHNWSDINEAKARNIKQVRDLYPMIFDVFSTGNTILQSMATIVELIISQKEGTDELTSIHTKVREEFEQFKEQCKGVIKECHDACYKCGITVGKVENSRSQAKAAVVLCGVTAVTGSLVAAGYIDIHLDRKITIIGGIIVAATTAATFYRAYSTMQYMWKSSEDLKHAEHFIEAITISAFDYKDSLCMAMHELNGLDVKSSKTEFVKFLEWIIQLQRKVEDQQGELRIRLGFNPGTGPA